MAIGIGASGIGGLAFEQLAPPVATSATPTAGGALTAGTYKYYITAINTNGETTISNELTGTTAAGNLTLALVWVAVSGATGYKIYRTASGGATGTELLLTTLGAVTTFNDAAVGAPAGAFPVQNTAATPGTYTAPTKFFPFNTESIVLSQSTVFRRPIRQSADIIGAVAGNYNPGGDIEMEALEDVLIYFLFASRTLIVQSGTSPNFIYTITPTAAAVPQKTMSLTFVRNGIVFGYTGMVVSNFMFGIADGLLTFKTGILGRDEAVQSAPVPTWPATVPFGAGSYSIEVPTATPVLDTDTFEWTVEDNAAVNFRLKNTGRGAQFINYGERNSTMTIDRDFQDRIDYDLFKSVTSQSVTLTASKGANNLITLLAPVTIKNTYDVGLSGQGNLVRASITYQNVIDGTGKSWQITVKTQELVT